MFCFLAMSYVDLNLPTRIKLHPLNWKVSFNHWVTRGNPLGQTLGDAEGTGKPEVLWSVGFQRVGHELVTEYNKKFSQFSFLFIFISLKVCGTVPTFISYFSNLNLPLFLFVLFCFHGQFG